MPDNFPSGNNPDSSSNPGPSMPPSAPSFGSGGSGGGKIKIGFVVFVIVLGAIIYFAQSYFTSNSFQNLGTQVSSITKTVGDALNDTSASDSNPTDTTAANPDDSLTKKLNAYVDLLNYVSDNVYSSYDRYGQWVDLQKGPTGKEKHLYGLYQLSDYSHYFDAAQTAHDLQPQIDLDKDFPVYQAAYDHLKPLVTQAYTYYDQGDYKDDNFAKGLKIHADLVAAFLTFEAASTKFDTDYEVVDIAQRQKEIALYKQEGRLIAFNSASALYLSQQTYISIREQLSKNGNDASKLDINDLKTKTDQFDTLLTTLKSQQTDKAGLKTEYGITGDSLYDSFVGDADAFIKSAKALYRGLRDQNLPARTDFADSTDGTPENLIKTYNQMVDSFNTMNRF